MAVPPTTKPVTADNSDPSMEEILASIRRILNEDDAPPPLAASPPEDDVLVLDKSMMVAPPPSSVESETVQEQAAAPMPEPETERETPVRTAHAEEAALVEPSPMQPDPAPVADPLPAPPAAGDAVPAPRGSAEPSPNLVAPDTAAATAAALAGLVRTLASDRRPQVWATGPTLEDLVRAELRPLLKAWLDANLPPVVERLVRAEIERVVGRAIP